MVWFSWPRTHPLLPGHSLSVQHLPAEWATMGSQMPSLPSQQGKKELLKSGMNSRQQKEEKRKSSILLILSAVFKQKVQAKELVGAVCQHCSSCDWKLSSHLLTYLLVKIYVSIHSYNLILLLKNKMQDCPLYF